MSSGGVAVTHRTLFIVAVVIVSAFWPSAALGKTAPGVTVFAGPNLAAPPPGVSPQADALAFFPKVATVHVGDRVTWQFRGFHTATFAGSNQNYPFIVPLGGTEPAAKDAAGQPLWWGGVAPLLGLSPLSVLPQGSSTISSPSEVRNSGLVRIFQATQQSPPRPYVLTFRKPGTYRYLCAVHPAMRGVVRVRPAIAPVPSAAAQKKQGAIELQRLIADAKALNQSKPGSNLEVLAGVGHKATGAEVASFFPDQLAVKTGDTVSFRNPDETDVHTVTFGPEALRTQIENNFAAPHGDQILLDPLGALPSESPGTPTPNYDGTNHGDGYLNSGILAPPGSPASAGPQSFQVTFTKPGTYQYECVIHEHMDGTIVVS
jgi:plastocyanin